MGKGREVTKLWLLMFNGGCMLVAFKVSSIPDRKRLFAGTVPANKNLFARTVPANKNLFAGTVLANNNLFAGPPSVGSCIIFPLRNGFFGQKK